MPSAPNAVGGPGHRTVDTGRELPAVFDRLRRWPDAESPELRAWDAADAYLLDEAESRGLLDGRDVVVIGDEYGALTLGALERGAASVRVHQDTITGERALAANAARGGVPESTATPARFTQLPLEAALVAGASLVLVRLPRSLDALDDIAALIAAHADPAVTVIAGGRIKHMSTSMNAVLSKYFDRVDVTLARQKSRLLIARDPIPGPGPELRSEYHADLDLTVCAAGGVFAGTAVDIGTRAMLAVLDGVPAFERAADLGCGTGILAASLARARPGATVIASDRSAAAVASARATMRANGLDVEVVRDAGLASQPDGSFDLVLLNPPFHAGAAVTTGIALELFADAARALRPGGELWTVWNSHLDYRPALERAVGPTRQVARTPKFTVTSSVRGGAGAAMMDRLKLSRSDSTFEVEQ